MEILGVHIPWSLIIAILIILVIWGGIRYVYWRLQTSAFAFIYRTIRNLLREEPISQMDFKEYRVDDEIKKIDKNFEKTDFLKMVENALRQYFKAFSENEHRLLLSFETPALFQRHKAQIEQNKKNKMKEVYRLQQIVGTKVVGVNTEKNRLTAEVICNLFRYKVNQNGTTISGSQTDLRKVSYVMTFHKAKTEKEIHDSVNCPNCGAPHSIHSAGICEYCGSMIVTFKDNWLLDDLKQI